MKPKLLLRIASIIILLHAVGHTRGVYTWNDDRGPVPQDLVKQMTDTTFSFMGITASMGRFYEGMGYASTIALLLVAFLLWVIGDNKDAALATKILLALFAFLVLLGIDEVIYFFPMAALFSFVAALLVLISIFLVRRTSNQ